MKRIIMMVAAVVAVMSFSVNEINAREVKYDFHEVGIDKLPSVEVRGKAVRRVEPDRLTLSIVVDEADYKGKASLAEKQEDLFAVLEKCEVPVQESLRVGAMGSSMTVSSFRKVVKSLSKATYLLELHDVATMQEVIRLLGEEKISRIELLKTEYSKRDDLEDELSVEASKNAKKRAELIAEAMGVKLGSALQVYTRPMYSNEYAPRFRADMFMSKVPMVEEAVDDDLSTSMSLSSAEMEFSVEVTAKFEILR